MSEGIERVVFDCNIFAQALLSPTGPAAGCVERVLDGTLRLYWSDYVLAEIRRISEKPTPVRMGITSEHVESLLARLSPIAHHMPEPPVVYEHPTDPKDSHYVNLAIWSDAKLIVSRDKHLLNLVNPAKPASRDFISRFPNLRVLRPQELLEMLRQK